LPAIVPSWRFFDAVTASPRLDYAVLTDADGVAEQWQEFRPRPAVLGPGTMLLRLLWNAEGNENLFLVSLAERLMTSNAAATEAHSQRELLLRVVRHLDRNGCCGRGDWLQIRLRFVSRGGAGEGVADEVGYVSAPFAIAELMTR
jgi:hypothetical protein